MDPRFFFSRLIPFFFIASCSRALIAFDLAPITPACSFFERFLLTHLLSLSTFRQLVLLHRPVVPV
jgi:hypothetical protein